MTMLAQTAPADAGTTSGAGRTGAAPTSQQFLCFVLSDDLYAVRIDMVREILEVAHMTPLPLMPDFVRGVMNLRGVVVPVIDLSARLGMATTTIGRRTCVVIVDVALPDESGMQTLGVLVDAVQEVLDVTPQDQEPVPRLGTSIDPAHLRSMVRVHGNATPELDLAAILDPARLVELISPH